MDVEEMDSINPLIPVKISHHSGLTFRLKLAWEEVEKFNTDKAYASEMANKYFEMYQQGVVSASGNTTQESEASTSQETAPPSARQNWSAEDEETLIRLVSERPPLYDYRLPLRERSKSAVKDLWEEVILQMNVDVSVDFISKKWKYIRDSFIRARANINKKLASGSSAEEKLVGERVRANHKNYDLLMFLDDSLSCRKTTSNLDSVVEVGEEAISNAECTSRESSTQSTPSTSRPTSRPPSKQGSYGQVSAQDQAFLDALKSLSGPKEMTSTQNFCLRLADGMDKLPPRVRNQVQVEFLQKLTEMENLYLYND